MDEYTYLSKDNFTSEVLQSNIPVLVDFWADWCGPCKVLLPTLDKLTAKYAGKIKFCKLNIDEDVVVAATYRIMSIPTLMYFRDGELVDKIVGVRSEIELSEWLDQML